MNTKILKIAEPKGNALEGFHAVIAAFGKTIGIRTLKSIEDIRLPVTSRNNPEAVAEFIFS